MFRKMRLAMLALASVVVTGSALAGSLTPVNTGLASGGAIAGNHVTGLAYVATGNSLSAVDLSTFNLAAVGNIPNTFTDVAVETRRNWVATVWSNNTVHVTNMDTLQEIGVASYSDPIAGINFDVKTGRLFVLNANTAEIDIIDSANASGGLFYHGFAFGAPFHAAMDPEHQVYFYTRQGLLDALYTDTNNPSYANAAGEWTLAASPATAVAVDPNYQQAFVAEPGQIEVFDTSKDDSSSYLGVIPFSGTIKKLVLDLRGNELYALTDSTITKINTRTRMVVDTVTASAGQTFSSLWVDNVNGNAYVTDGSSTLYYYVQPAPPAGVKYRMRFFGPSPTPGTPMTSNLFYANQINDHGQAVGYSQVTFDSFLNDCDGVTYHIFAGRARVRGINNHQQLSGSYLDSSGGRHAFVSDFNGNYTFVAPLTSRGFELDDNADMTGWWTPAGRTDYFVSMYDATTGTYNFTDIPLNSGGSAYLLEQINLAGEAVGAEWFSGVLHAVVYQSGTLMDVGCLGSNTLLWHINNSNQAVGWGITSDGAEHGLVYDDLDGLQDMGSFQGYSELEGINDNGVMVGEEDDPTISFAVNALILDPAVGYMQDLNAMTDTSSGYLNGWSQAINNNNEILVNGAEPDGTYNWWILEPVASANLNTFSLNPDTVAGGASSTGTLVLNSPAGSGGVTVSISSDNPDAQVPSSVTVDEGTLMKTFTITTTAVSGSESALITATYGSSSQAATLYIGAPVLTSVDFAPTTVKGGTPVTGTVTLSSQAPAGGVSVTVASSDSSAVPDSPVVVPAGQSSVTFNIQTSAVAADAVATISATQGSTTVYAPQGLTIYAPRVTSASIAPAPVNGGQSTNFTVYLDSPAPSGGIAVAVSSDNPSVAHTAGSTVSITGTQGGGAITTVPVNADTLVTFTFSYLDSSTQVQLLVKAAQLSVNSLNPGTLFGGSSSTGSLLLSGPCGPAGGTVTLSSSNTTVARVPATVSFNPNQIKRVYTVTTSAVTATTLVNITASWKGVSKVALLTVKAPQLLSLGFQNLSGATITSTKQGTYVKVKVSLNGPAPSGGARVNLTSSRPSTLPVPSFTIVPAGASFTAITVRAGAVSTTTSVTVTGTYSGLSKSSTLKVTP
jgi:hypothetical protein